MKKILVFLVMMSLLGVMVWAVDQGAEVDVSFDSTFVPTPDPIDFGILFPGDNNVQAITLTPGTSDLAISVDITGAVLLQGILADRTGSYIAYDDDSFTMIASTPLIFNTKLVVPLGQDSGSYSGTITYTVLEA